MTLMPIREPTQQQRATAQAVARTLAKMEIEYLDTAAVGKVLLPEQRKRLNRWLKKRADRPITEIEAIRRFVEEGLSSK